jgi:fatty-acyl-CoA synthase
VDHHPSPTPAQTLVDLLERRRHDPTPGIVRGDRSWTWAEAVAESECWGAAIEAAIGPGVRHVGLLMENTPEYLLALLGAARRGITTVGLNATRRGEELRRDILHTDCAVVLTDPAGAPLLRDLDLGATSVFDVADTPWASALAAASEAPPSPAPEVGPADPLLLIFTSGSTSAPKAVIMSHGRAARMAEAASWFSSDDVLYCAMPLFHGNALNAIVFPALATGATIAVRERFSASQFFDDLRRYGATFFTSVGRALGYVLATPERPDDREHSVKFALAPESSPADVREFRRRFGITCVAGYGSSENAVIFVPVPGMPRDALGQPQDGIEAAVVDAETAEPCPPARFDDQGRMTNAEEAIGEIVGLNVLDRFEGYYANPEADAERSRNGWFWTGDLGYVDDAGFFYFAGRQGDWLRVDSENFATAPIERLLDRFEPVAAVAVFAVPDERTADDQVMAALELAPGAEFDPAAFEAFLAAQDDLGTKWTPRYLRIGTLPVGATNKIDRRRLQRERWYTDDPLHWRRGSSDRFEPFTSTDLAELEARFAEHGRSPGRS